MLELHAIPVAPKRAQSRVGCCIVTRTGRERYLERTLKGLRTQPVDILLWTNGPIDLVPPDGCVYFHQHAFNVGQHVAHNEMLDECVRRGYDWHIRVDDDCWINSRTWLKQLLSVQEQAREITGKYCVLGLEVTGLDNPIPPSVIRPNRFELKKNVIVDRMDILGGIFRMSPMPLMRYFRWDERQAMGFGDATQFKSYCESAGVAMLRVKNIHCAHGGSTRTQALADAKWDYEHDMLQFIPLGL